MSAARQLRWQREGERWTLACSLRSVPPARTRPQPPPPCLPLVVVSHSDNHHTTTPHWASRVCQPAFTLSPQHKQVRPPHLVWRKLDMTAAAMARAGGAASGATRYKWSTRCCLATAVALLVLAVGSTSATGEGWCV